MKQKKLSRQSVLAQMMALAAGEANDVVKLAYLDEERKGEIDGLDLQCLTEFKRSSSGAVEVKLTDRVAVLEKLLEQLKEEENQGPAAFLESLDRPVAPEGMCSQR
ncbi:MAG: XRE family transcriptional regulator [Clostridiales bacterium]|nr:XRE family transcriptional regulator [Clostridiales bacterium]MDY4173219.1 XRE family transcriptional regulator [Evtepia sp.]